MAEFRRDRRVYLAAVFFAFGVLCGILTGRCASAALAAATSRRAAACFASSAKAASVLCAMTAPLLMLFLSMTLFGSLLILPCVLLAGGVFGWVLCCAMRCGLLSSAGCLLPLCMLIPQAPCLMCIAASCMRLSASLRRMVSSRGLRRPDLSSELRVVAAAFFVKLLTAVLFAMLLERQGIF